MSTKSAQSPRCGVTWSTTVARTRSPNAAHSRQNGSRSNWPGRSSSSQTLVRYIQRHSALSVLAAFFGLCSGHQPSRVRFGHPGLRHGRRGFRATGYHLRAKQKAPEPTHPRFPGGCSGSGARRCTTLAQALVDIHDGFLLAVLAPNRPVAGRGVGPHPLLGRPSAPGTDYSSVLCDYSTTINALLQPFQPPFYSFSEMIICVSRPIKAELAFSFSAAAVVLVTAPPLSMVIGI